MMLIANYYQCDLWSVICVGVTISNDFNVFHLLLSNLIRVEYPLLYIEFQLERISLSTRLVIIISIYYTIHDRIYQVPKSIITITF